MEDFINSVKQKLAERIPENKLNRYIDSGLLKFEVEDKNSLKVFVDNSYLKGSHDYYFYKNDSKINIERITKIVGEIDEALSNKPLYSETFTKSDIQKLSKGGQNFKNIFNMKDELEFVVYDNPRFGDEYAMKIKHQSHIPFSWDESSKYTKQINLGSHPSLEGATKFFANQFLTEDSELVAKVKEFAKKVPVVGDNEEIGKLLSKNTRYLIERCLTMNSNGGIKFDVIQEFDFNNEYGRFSIGVKTGKNSTSHSCINAQGVNLEDFLPQEVAQKINDILEKEKLDITNKNSSDWAKENQFNKLKSIFVEWSEIGALDGGKTYTSFDELQNDFKNAYRHSTYIPPAGVWDKTKLNVKLENKNGEIINITPRIDVSDSRGDFNPFREDIKYYLVEKCGYNASVTKESSTGLNIVINLEGVNNIGDMAIDRTLKDDLAPARPIEECLSDIEEMDKKAKASVGTGLKV